MDSTPRAYRLKASNAAPPISTFPGAIPLGGLSVGGSLSVGTLTQLQSAIGAATTLMAGCLYVTDKIKEYAPVVAQLKATEAEFKDDAAFGLHNFYGRIEAESKG